MTTSTTLFTFRGKTAAKRSTALMLIAPQTLQQERSRADYIANLRVALSNKPSKSVAAIVRQEIIVGRVVATLPAGEYPKAKMDDGAKLVYARSLVTEHARPDVKKLRKGQIGRRTATQQKAIRAAEQYATDVLAELGMNNAQKVKDKNKKSRAPHRKQAKVPAPVMASDLPPAKEVTPDDHVNYFMSQSSTLEQYAKKYAGSMPMQLNEVAEIVAHLRTACMAAANAWQEAKAKRDAEQAERETENA